MESWNLPEDPYERQQRVSEIADGIIQRYDEAFYAAMEKILAEVRSNIARTAISNTPFPQDTQELE